MNDAVEYFLHTNPAFPWNLDRVGLPLLAGVAGLLIVLTIWTYRGHPSASRGRILTVMTLRLLALLVVLLTAVRPSLGIREQPKMPAQLLIGVDVSQSMTVADEFGGVPRIDAVRKALDRCAPILEELKAEQNVTVTVYALGSPEFQEAAWLFDPKAPADAPKSDYATYLARTLERWQGKPFVRGHLILGDGRTDSVTATTARDLAAKWKSVSPVHTFLVGTTTPPNAARDVAITEVVCDPNPVAVKTEYTLRARVTAVNFRGEVPMKVQYDLGDGKGYADVRIETVKLSKEDNTVEMRVKAPEAMPEDANKKPIRQIKVRVEIPPASVDKDANHANNVMETYLNLTKEGLRVLVVDRFRYEYALLLDALAADPRIDVRKVDLQSDEGGPGLQDAFNFADRAYDVLILGNVSAKQLTAIDPKLPDRIREQVIKKGMGFMMIGGHATFSGDAEYDDATGWKGVAAIEDILPVNLPPRVKNPKSDATYQFVIPPRLAGTFFLRLDDSPKNTEALWDRLNTRLPRQNYRFSGLSALGLPKAGAEVYAYASDDPALVDRSKPDNFKNLSPLLVGHQIGDGSKGRVLAFAAMDTMSWQRLGLPKTTEGKQLHKRFWQQLVLWLAHQDTDDGAAFARPEFPRVGVGRKQGIAVGLRGPNGAEVLEPTFAVKVLGPNETDGKPQTVVIDPKGGFKVKEKDGKDDGFVPTAPGEYTVTLTASGRTADGKEVKGEATAKFISYAEVSEEMVNTAADPDLLEKLASAGGGKAYRLDDLAAYLKELKGQPLVAVKPKARYLPSWEPKWENGFLPTWLVIFTVLLGLEWGLRRWWGMV